MAYQKTIWKNREVERPRTYQLQDNGDGTYTLIPAEGTIIEAGTPITAQVMNNIENGIESLDQAFKTHLAENASKHIAESGSNDDGYYIKWDDGTMECYRNALPDWTSINVRQDFAFPVEFVSVPSGSMSFSSSGTLADWKAYSSAIVMVTAIAWRFVTLESITTNRNVYLSAIGRWK